MRYFGGKTRIRQQIAEYLESIRKPNQTYFEPFCGGAWVLQEISGKRIASDGNTALITMYKALQDGWVPPDSIGEQEYKAYMKRKPSDDPMTAFIGFGCSFAGKWFGGYARSNERNYALNARNSLLKQASLIKDVAFVRGMFQEHCPNGYLVYCDPPYEGTTQYGAFDRFDHVLFWNTMRKWSENNTIIISEYHAPNDFECVKEIETKTDIRVGGLKEKRIERLFRMKSHV